MSQRAEKLPLLLLSSPFFSGLLPRPVGVLAHQGTDHAVITSLFLSNRLQGGQPSSFGLLGFREPFSPFAFPRFAFSFTPSSHEFVRDGATGTSSIADPPSHLAPFGDVQS